MLENKTRRVIALFVGLVIVVMTGLNFFLREPLIPHKRPLPEYPVHVSVSNPQETLLFLELINKKNTLHPDWYELINPITYVVANGIIQSIGGYLLLDITKPMHIALFWEENQKYPTVILSLPSQQGVQGSENLRRNLLPYGEIQQHGFQWHGNIQLPKTRNTSLSWEGTAEQILLAWRPFPSDTPFDRSAFASSAPPTNTVFRFDMENIPALRTIISNLSINVTSTSKTIRLNGTGQWDHMDTTKPSYPLDMIAGWSVPGIPPFQVHKLHDAQLCFAGEYPKIQKHLRITKKCSLYPTQGVFAFFDQPLFSHMDIPLRRIELSAWGTSETFTIQGSLVKGESRGLFPLYVWVYELLMNP